MAQLHKAPFKNRKVQSNLAKFVPLSMGEEYVAYYGETSFSRRTAGLVLTNQRLVHFKKQECIISLPVVDIKAVNFDKMRRYYMFSVFTADHRLDIRISEGLTCQSMELLIADVQRRAGRDIEVIRPVTERNAALILQERHLASENIDRVVQQARWDAERGSDKAWSSIDFLTFSPDGTLLASSTSWKTTSSPDETLLASLMFGETTRLWRVSDGVLVHTLENQGGATFAPDGTQIATVSESGVHFWRLDDGVLIHTIEDRRYDLETRMAFSPDGTQLAMGAGDTRRRVGQRGVFLLWRISDSWLLHKQLTVYSVTSVAFSPDGTMLALGDSDGNLDLHPTSNLFQRRPLKGYHKSSLDFKLADRISREKGVRESWVYLLSRHVNSVAFSPDGLLLAASCPDKTVRVWRVSDSTLLRTVEMHNPDAFSLCVSWSPCGKLLASGSSDGTVHLWRVSDAALLRTLEGHEGAVRSVAFSPEEILLASGSLDGTVILWGA